MRKEKEHLSLRVKWLKIAGAHNFGVVWGLKHVIARLCCCISENIYTHWDHFRRGAREREIERVRAQMLHNILYAIRRQHRLKTAKRKNWASTEKNDQREHTKKKISSKRESKRKETAHEHTEKGYVLLLLYCFIFFLLLRFLLQCGNCDSHVFSSALVFWLSFVVICQLFGERVFVCVFHVFLYFVVSLVASPLSIRANCKIYIFTCVQTYNVRVYEKQLISSLDIKYSELRWFTIQRTNGEWCFSYDHIILYAHGTRIFACNQSEMSNTPFHI